MWANISLHAWNSSFKVDIFMMVSSLFSTWDKVGKGKELEIWGFVYKIHCLGNWRLPLNWAYHTCGLTEGST